jgi:hypothetical protein
LAVIKEQQIKQGVFQDQEENLDSVLARLEEGLIVRRDVDILTVAEGLTNLGLFTHDIASVCLFDIYRGNFSEETVHSARIRSTVHVNAKLKLMSLILQQILDMPG